jgi:hypothetical protein
MNPLGYTTKSVILERMLQLLIFLVGIIALPCLIARIFGLDYGERSWRLAVIGAAISFVAIFIIRLWPVYDRSVNFVEHAVGGGVPSAFMLAALLVATKRRFTWLQELALLFFFVSGTGALNELLEFLGDTVTTFQFSIDRFDTWYDILANSLGALAGWLVIRVLQTMKRAT